MNTNYFNKTLKSVKLNFLFFRNYRISKKADLKVSDDLHEIIIGSLLGDLTAERPNINCNTRLQFKQSIINKEYIYHLYGLFQGFCGTGPLNLSYFDTRINKNKVYKSIKFQTLSLSCFNIYRELFYNTEGKKILPLNIEFLLTVKGLAYWLMDDGYKSGKGLYIYTESFSLTEIKLLINVLKNKFNLECNYHKVTNGYRIYIFSTSKINLIKLVKPYFIKEFYYKLELDQENK